MRLLGLPNPRSILGTGIVLLSLLSRGAEFLDMSDLVYHYCSTQTFTNIIGTGVLWATKAAYLADPTDCLWLLNHLRDETLRHGRFVEKLPQEAARYARTMVRSLLANECATLEGWSQDHMLACFSRDPSTLSQWRHYADDCRGVALGVDLEVVAREVRDQEAAGTGHTFGWKDVAYGDPGVAALFEQVQQAWLHAAEHKDSGDYMVEHKAGLIDLLEEQLCDLVRAKYAYTKNPAYAEEAEVRLIVPNVVEIWPRSWNLVRGTIVPCCEVPLGPNPQNEKPDESALRSVVLGPRFGTQVSDVQAWLTATGFGAVDIVTAGIEL